MSECPNCGNHVEDDSTNICPHCNFSFIDEHNDDNRNYWYFMACLIIVLIIATPFLTIIFIFP